MSKKEEILKFIVNNMALEKMKITEKEEKMLKDCLNGKKSTKSALREVIKKYSPEPTK